MITLNKFEKYLVAVSGGPDSMFLLNNVKNYQIVVCHVNYHFREDSNVDQLVVENFCKENQIPLEVLNVETDYENLNQNFEEFARETRYTFFQKIATKYKINNLLVAHNYNDLVETFIMQQRRQNYVDFFGLRQITNYQNITIIRPMLHLLKSYILAYLKINNIVYAIDSTNSDPKYLRNLIRQNLQEKDFGKYQEEIEKANKNLRILKNEVQFYTNNNISAGELILTNQLQNFNIEKIMRIIFAYFKLLKQDQLLQKRKNSTIKEIAVRIKTSNKVFWQIALDDFYLVKDFDKLFLILKSDFQFKTFKVSSKDDLYVVEEFINWLDIFNAIKSDGENYPYIVTNDYEMYKQKTTIGRKKTNRYLIDNKIPYRKRVYKAVVYQENKLQILNKMTG